MAIKTKGVFMDYKEKMIRQMELKNFSKGTQTTYFSAINKLCAHFGREPEEITTQEVEDYIILLQEEKILSPSTIHSYINAFKFLFNKALNRRVDRFDIDNRKSPKTLPEILSVNEVKRIIQSADNLRRKVILLLAYSSGLRASEIMNLKISDIDSKRMMIRVVEGKNRKDRYTILNPHALLELRAYWIKYKPKNYLFPGKEGDERPACNQAPLKAWRIASRRAGITKGRGIHTLRHCFATHLLEAGVDLRTIQVMMGHSSIQTTSIYLKVTSKQMENTQCKVDLLKYY
jgi:integrase/recombinase XerD